MDNFYFPESETIYGQTFLCITLSSSDIDDVGKQLTYNHPKVYFSSISSSSQSKYPNVGKVLNKDFVSGADNSTLTIGKFTVFAKTGKWGKDLYADMVAPSLGADLLVETWIRGDAIGKDCPPDYKNSVCDVTTLKAGDIEWREEQDHSKWAVTLDTSSYACIGDINRMTSQRKRGGGTACIADKILSDALYNTITGSDQC